MNGRRGNQQKLLTKSYMRRIQNVVPGPKDPSVLTRQGLHRSSDIWESEGEDAVRSNLVRLRCGRVWIPHPNLHTYIMKAGFVGIMQVQGLLIDHALMTALVERWRPETHTFHFPVGEMAVTLEDVAMLFGLPVDGEVVTGSYSCDWVQLCQNELGMIPTDENEIKGSSLHLPWLLKNFSVLPEAEDYEPEVYDVVLQRFAKAWILAVVGSVLCPTSSGDVVSLSYLLHLGDLTKVSTYSWGSAVLANLYRGLCGASKRRAKEMSGCALLLQLWSWERLHIGRPEVGVAPLVMRNKGKRVIRDDANAAVDDDDDDDEDNDNHDYEPAYVVALHPSIVDSPYARVPCGHRWTGAKSFRKNPRRGVHYYRSELDSQKTDEVKWQPYENVNEGELTPLCFAGRNIWRCKVPLICYDVVEWHFPDRVLCQFGLVQGIPAACNTEPALHLMNKQGKHKANWGLIHAPYVLMWGERGNRVVNADPAPVDQTRHSDTYLQWYRNITRLFVAPPEVLNQRMPNLKYHAKSALWSRLVDTLVQVVRRCESSLKYKYLVTSTARGFVGVRSLCISALRDAGEMDRLIVPAGPILPPPARPQGIAGNVIQRGESSSGSSRPPPRPNQGPTALGRRRRGSTTQEHAQKKVKRSG